MTGIQVPKFDLLGSYLTRGVQERRFDRAVRRVQVSGIANTNQGLQEAVDAILNQNPQFHQSVDDLPLSRIRVTRYGPTKAWAELIYQRLRTGSFPTRPPTLVARFRAGYEFVPVYRPTVSAIPEETGEAILRLDDLTGFPTGPEGITYSEEILTDLLNRPDPLTMARRPILRFSAPTQLAFNPLDFRGPDGINVFRKVGSVNTDTVLFGGFKFPPKTVRFDHIDVDWVDTVGGGVQYAVDYNFTAARGIGVAQEMFIDPDAATQRWEPREVPIADDFRFGGSFPVA